MQCQQSHPRYWTQHRRTIRNPWLCLPTRRDQVVPLVPPLAVPPAHSCHGPLAWWDGECGTWSLVALECSLFVNAEARSCLCVAVRVASPDVEDVWCHFARGIVCAHLELDSSTPSYLKCLSKCCALQMLLTFFVESRARIIFLTKSLGVCSDAEDPAISGDHERPGNVKVRAKFESAPIVIYFVVGQLYIVFVYSFTLFCEQERRTNRVSNCKFIDYQI